MTVQRWISDIAQTLLTGDSLPGRSRRRRFHSMQVELLEFRQVLSALTITASFNGQPAGDQTQPLAEIDKSLTHTWELRNTGTEPLKITGIVDDGANGFQSTPHAISRFIPVAGRRDTVHDAKRGLLYITADDGYVRRFDLVEGRFLSAFNLGGKPLSLDLSPNENQLLVSNQAGPWVHLIDLETSVITRKELPGPDISLNGVFVSDTEYVLSVGQSIVGQSVSRPSANSYPLLAVSADRSTIVYAGIGVTPAPVGRFQMGDSHWRTTAQSAYNMEIAASRNGQQTAVVTYFGTYVYDQSLQQLSLIGTYGSDVPIGAVYSPVTDTLYLSWSDSYQQHASIEAWNATTLQRTAIIDPAWRFSWPGNMSFEMGRLKISRDGQTLISTVPGGIQVYGTDDLLPRFTSGDTNANGLIDPGEIWTYTARDLSQRGVRQHTLRVNAESTDGPLTETVTLAYRGVTYNIDYGDAPDPRYPTLFSSNGAAHTIASGIALGSTVDQDLDAQPDSAAGADDRTGRDDDDGVTFSNPLVPGTRTTIDVQVTSRGAARLNAWIDFNGDGDWNDAGEQFAKDVAVVSGLNYIPVEVPATAKPGTTFSRFRLNTSGGLSVTGRASDGEVEDHLLTINPVVPSVQKIAGSVSPDVAFSWQPSPFISRYEVQLSPRGNTPGTTIRQVTSHLTWQPESLLGFGKYAFWVRALDGEQNASRWSPIQEFSVVSSPVVSVPFVSTFDRTPELNWSAVPSAVGYDIHVQLLNTPLPAFYALIRNVQGTKWSPPAILARGTYKFWVRGVNAVGQTTAWSANPVQLAVGGKPRFLTPQGSLPLDQPLSWFPVSGVDHYELWVDQIGGTRKLIWEEQLTGTDYTPTFALPRGTYSVWLRAISSSGETSTWSDTLKLNVAQDRPPLTPVGPTLIAQPEFRWQPTSSATSYDVLLQKMEGSAFLEHTLSTNLATPEFIPASPLEAGKWRAYFRSVQNGIAGSWQSPPAEIDVGGPPERVTIDRTRPEAPRLTWVSVEGAVSYEVQVRRAGSTSNFLQVQGITSTDFQPEYAWPKGDYVVSVRALDVNRAPSLWSSPVIASVPFERAFLAGTNPTFDRTPEFAWPAIPGAVSYDLRLERQSNSGFLLSASYEDIRQTRFTPFIDLLEGTYRAMYRKHAIGPTQEPWQFSAVTFHVGGKTSIRAITVESSRLLRVLWRTVDAAAKSEIWIKETGGSGLVIQKTFNATSEYRLDTPLPVGSYRIWVRSISSEGTAAPWSEPGSFAVT